MQDVISRIVDLVNELQEVAEEKSLSVDLSRFGAKKVHVTKAEHFFEMFSDFDTENRSGESEFLYKAKVEVEDIQFFTLLTEENYAKYVTKTA